MSERRAVRDPLLLEIAAAIGAGRIRIQSIRDDGELCHGYTFKDGEIVLNPIVEMVDTAVHECLHRLRPAWSEQTVKRTTTKLLRQMSYDEIDKLYTLIGASAKTKRGPLYVGKRSRKTAVR
jgi:hypothetical protein